MGRPILHHQDPAFLALYAETAGSSRSVTWALRSPAGPGDRGGGTGPCTAPRGRGGRTSGPPSRRCSARIPIGERLNPANVSRKAILRANPPPHREAASE